MECILEPTQTNLELASSALARGKLVAFPTETVYGLGGNALMEDTVRKIYEVKGRPATDPLICHVDTLAKAVRLWDPSWDEGSLQLASAIGASLWPGPLTIVCRANPSLPVCVTGGSSFVGARIPRHPTTLGLLSLLDFPLAGPSANVFGHVSPTTARHVYDDLFSRDPELLILDGGGCEIGIESTVVKINSLESVEVVRRGGTSVSAILRAIADRFPSTRIDIRDTRSRLARVDAPMDAPGQLLTHYSPAVMSSLVTPSSLAFGSLDFPLVVRIGVAVFPIEKIIVIDYKGVLWMLRHKCIAYRDLSPEGNAKAASFDVFDTLRWTESVKGAGAVVFPLLSEWPEILDDDVELLAAVEDRLFRAASGTVAVICNSDSS
ncbi:unnamed protein product [Phytomonas sp. EM1]|nr:unnamed protein product [Phytomonas sp. EM1]|eukprot:CCW62290.1 unnamed protein product [Phytomonas sp. isolate EM1]